MGNDLVNVENMKTLWRILHRPLAYLGRSSIRRNLTALVLLMLVLFISAMWLTTTANRADEESKDKISMMTYLSKREMLTDAVAWAKLCITATQEKNSNAGLYCSLAVIKYQKSVDNRTIESKSKLIAAKAYDGMALDIESGLRQLENANKLNGFAHQAQVMLEFVLQKPVVLIVELCVLLLFLFIPFLLKRFAEAYDKEQSEILAKQAHQT